jgi:hypothetical protein
MSIPRAFTDDDSNLGIKSGLTIKQKFNLLCTGILCYFSLHCVENLA